MRKKILVGALAAAFAIPVGVYAETLRWASQGDILTLDPHAQNEGLTIAASSYVYEPLVEYDKEFNLIPALAVEWDQPEPEKWVFQLREGVSFHDGAPFSAADVVFSIERAMAPNSNFKAYVNGIKDVKAIDDYTVEIETDGPNPVLLRQLTNVFIMNKKWAEEHDATEPQDLSAQQETYSARHAKDRKSTRLKSSPVA